MSKCFLVRLVAVVVVHVCSSIVICIFFFCIVVEIGVCISLSMQFPDYYVCSCVIFFFVLYVL